MHSLSRRDAIHAVGGAYLLTRAGAEVTPELLKFSPEIEPLAALIEWTPRERCAEMAVEQLRRGVSYRQFLAALFLAGVRNVNPRPPGFALHCVFIIHSAHLLGLEAPADSRLLPLFYALDNFKTAQERDAKSSGGDYTMRALRGPLPAPDRAAAELLAAMEAWDQERAERAAAVLARHRAAPEVLDMLWRYGARDYRNIGHKAIYAANAARTLQTIGWQHAEPVLRSLVLAMLDFGREQKLNGYALVDQCYTANLKHVKETFPRLHDTWTSAPAAASAARDALELLREASPDEACAAIAGGLVKGTLHAASVWDAVHLAAAELRLRAASGTAIAAIHAVTSANALHRAYLAAPGAELRYLLLLQAAGWMAQFRSFAGSREGGLREFPITDLAPADADAPLDEILAGIPSKLDESARHVLRSCATGLPARQSFLAAALRHTISKANEVHYYKYLAAILEDVALVSPEWQPRLLAAALYYMKGPGDPEPEPMKRAREALRALSA